MRYWLSFDLVRDDDFTTLYEWLDVRDAKECGDGLAVFSSDEGKHEVLSELDALTLSPRCRLYLIHNDKGAWVRGKRRRTPPWAGFASVDDDDEEF